MRRLPVGYGMAMSCILLGLVLFPSISYSENFCAQPVQTESGLVRGMEDKDSRSCVWLGIPYAAPPVGERRWKAPVPAQPWSGVREAENWGNMCLQQKSPFVTEPREKTDVLSEDCLYLNIWRPNKPGRFPVMFWIHGGGYTMGSGKYPGGKLSEFGEVVVVTINYRLGVFGFMASPALREEDPNQSTGSYGSLDQVAALKWVKENIANFGGDPTNITIFGESAGGWSVCTMLATPLNNGMFSKAIIQSGGCEASESLEKGYAKAGEIASKVGCGADDLKCLRAVPADKLVMGGVGDILRNGFQFVPHEDGYVLNGTPLAMIRAGNFNKVPLMAGSTKEEVNVVVEIGRPRLSNALPCAYEKLMQRNLNLSAEEAEKVAAVYRLEKYDNKPKHAFAYMLTDLALACPTFLGLASVAQANLPVYYYRYDYQGFKYGKYLHAMHSMELPLVFNSIDKGSMSGLFNNKNVDQARELSKIIQGYWTNFAKNGNPNGPGLPLWPAFDPANPLVQILDVEVRSEATDSPERCSLWDGYAQAHTPIWENLARHEKKRKR